MEIVLIIFIYLFATIGSVNLLGWLLTRPSVKVWRQELTATRWQRAAYVFGFSPTLALPLVDKVLGSWSPALPVIGWMQLLPMIGTGLILLFVPVLAGCWLATPQYEGEHFSAVRAWFAALMFTFTNVVGVAVVGELISIFSK